MLTIILKAIGVFDSVILIYSGWRVCKDWRRPGRIVARLPYWLFLIAEVPAVVLLTCIIFNVSWLGINGIILLILSPLVPLVWASVDLYAFGKLKNMSRNELDKVSYICKTFFKHYINVLQAEDKKK